MEHFEEAVSIFMSTPVQSIAGHSSLLAAEASMISHGVGSLAVVDDSEHIVGVLSMSDLLRARAEHASGNTQVASVMTDKCISVELDSSVAAAAALMVAAHVHRVFVTARGALAGVLSTQDIMAAIEAARLNKTASDVMSTPVFTISASEPLTHAVEKLVAAKVTGLIVVDESGWPVGVFGQEEALESRDLPKSARLIDGMNSAVVTVPAEMALHNVARLALATKARRVAVLEQGKLLGVISGVDFAKAILSH